ncbi:hypothetical protein [Variovorax sp. dw_954]|uniref:hypothetical protein n=1 Tax=Variovorax sp. dw_954 TaxID=2720078 RepID=UPI001BD554D8|nr:hypothetical protein [Variovorax sp. dw_954]
MLQSDNPAVVCLYRHHPILSRHDQQIAWTGNEWPTGKDLDVFAMATGRTVETPPAQKRLKESFHE